MGTFVSDVCRRANGNWEVILPQLGIDVPARGKHGACPVCGGTDRLHFDDKDGRGTWFCRVCDKAGDGLNMVQGALNKTPTEAAELVANALGIEGGKALDPAERARLDKGVAERKAKGDEETEHKRQKAATRAAAIMRDTSTWGNTYLDGKALEGQRGLITKTGPINVGGMSFPSGSLVVPLVNEAGDLVNVQMIDADGQKRYLPGGQIAGAYHRIKGAELVAVVEGCATGMSVHLATGATVYCSMGCGNLLAVAEIARRRHPEARIAICGDNDTKTEGNPGKTKAEQAAAAVGGVAVIPSITGDWNDFHQVRGLTETTTKIMTQINKGKEPKEASQNEISSLASDVVPIRPDADMPELDPDALAKMPSSRLGRLLAAQLGTPAVCRDSAIVYRYGCGVWQAVADARLTPMLAKVFDAVDCPYSSRKLKGAVDTMKEGLPDMGRPAEGLIGFVNGVYDLKVGCFREHSPAHFLPSHNGITYEAAQPGEMLESHAPSFYKWLSHAADSDAAKMDRINAALFMVLANRYDWQLFLEVTGEGGTGKSVMANLCELLVGKENVGSTSMEAMRDSFGMENIWDKRLILLPDQSQYVGDGAKLKAITGGDEVAINRKGLPVFGAKVRAVVIATNNEPMKMTERNGGVSRRRVIFAFNNVVADADRDRDLGCKIAAELPVIIRHLLTRFAEPDDARDLLIEQRDGAEALTVKQEADPVTAMCALLEFLGDTTGLRVGGGNSVPDPTRFLYHFYLEYLKAEGLDRPLHRTAFGKAMKSAAKAYGQEYQTRKSNGDSVTNVKLKDEARSVLPQARLLDD